MENVVILVLSLLLMGNFFLVVYLLNQISQLKNKLSKVKGQLKDTKDERDKLVTFEIGDKALINDFRLENKSVNVKFGVNYEVEIVDVSKDTIKVRAIDYTSYDSHANEVKYRQGIINFMQDKWIPKEDAEIIMSDSKKRDLKLSKLGIK